MSAEMRTTDETKFWVESFVRTSSTVPRSVHFARSI